MISPTLVIHENINDTAYRSAIAKITDRYMEARFKPPFGGVNNLSSMLTSIYGSDERKTLPLSQQDIEYYHDRAPEIYFFILTVHAYRSRDVYSLDHYHDEFKHALRRIIIDYEKAMGGAYIADASDLIEKTFYLTFSKNIMERGFRFLLLDYLVDLISEIINEGAGLNVILMHSFLKSLTSTNERMLEFHNYPSLVRVGDTDQYETYMVDIHEKFLQIDATSILASLMSVCARGKSHRLSSQYMSDVAVSWITHLCLRNDGLVHLCDPSVLKMFFDNSGLYNDRFLLERIIDCARLEFGESDSLTKNVKKHINYMKLKHSF